MVTDIGAFLEAWKHDRAKMREETPDILRGFGGMFRALMKEGALSVREKELIALGIGLALRCDACIVLHVQSCLNAGATREQILETVGVSVVMQGGPSLTYMHKVIAALDHLEKKE